MQGLFTIPFWWVILENNIHESKFHFQGLKIRLATQSFSNFMIIIFVTKIYAKMVPKTIN
jgi:hypothetical protein